jgi:hypothetical protein
VGKRKPSKKEIAAALWKRGDLTYKFNAVQKILYSEFKKDKRRIIPILVSRQTGKTFLFFCMAVMDCLKKEFNVVKFLQPTQKELKKTARQIMRTILTDCPEALKPEWKESENIYIFKNGSEIQLAGSDGKRYDSLRGGSSVNCYVDEGGFCDDLYDAVFSVLRPTTITTKGNVFIASTPSKLMSHDFIQHFVKPSQALGKLKIFTVHDNPMIDDEERQSIIDGYPGGEENTEYQREYLCKIIQDDSTVVLGEFSAEIQEACIRDVEIPPYYDIYTSMDIGFAHLTIVLFGYYDYLKASLIICGELVINGPKLTSKNLAIEIREKDKEFFSDEEGEVKLPFLRVADNNNPILLNDLLIDESLYFQPTRKDNKDAQINQTKMMISKKQIIISPKCKHLIYHMINATWNKQRNDYKKIPDMTDSEGKLIKGGHADGVDALIYLVRNLNKRKNPYPDEFDAAGNTFSSRPQNKNIEIEKMFKTIMNMK